MQGILNDMSKFHLFDYTTPSSLTSLTNKQVSGPNAKLSYFTRIGPHRQFICCTYREPLYMLSLEIWDFNI